jgi:DNA-binding GntR family transcriptional regulator
MFHTVMDQSHRARMLTLRLRPKPTASVREHRAIIDAIQKGDPQTARERAKRHRVTARNQLLPLLGEFGMKHL